MVCCSQQKLRATGKKEGVEAQTDCLEEKENSEKLEEGTRLVNGLRKRRIVKSWRKTLLWPMV